MTISRIAQRFQPIVFALLLFTIPSNLFAKFFVNSAYVDGLIVDYLIPKLYLSDIFVIALILLWCAELGFSTVAVRLRKHVISILIVLGFLALNFLASLNTGHWPATLYFDLKLLEMWGLLAWLFTHRSLLLSSKTVIALSSAIIFEAAVGVYQSIAQRSVFGFWFFGEPMLNLDVTVAKSNYSGALRILPYGTTPHPNILAGFMVMATLMCLYIGLHQEKKMIRVSALILAVVSSIMAILTQSFSAATALVLGLTLFC
ncbi:MAG TPA: hypothetical protein VFG51_02245, partial [Candidatus Saccharimonadia bacterium]|nr:hypothetical protein [Candidatus Saccharimonadia bacterium]